MALGPMRACVRQGDGPVTLSGWPVGWWRECHGVKDVREGELVALAEAAVLVKPGAEQALRRRRACCEASRPPLRPEDRVCRRLVELDLGDGLALD